MFQSFIEKLRSPTQQQQASSAGGPGLGKHGRPDQEEDGFLVVGQTASERNTIMPAHHNANGQPGQGFPPSYSQVQQSGNYPVQTASSGAWSSHLPSTAPSMSSPTMSSDQDDALLTDHSPTPLPYATRVTDDIPFRLSEQLDFAHKLTTDMSYFAVPHLQTYNPTKYLYDFEEERRVLRETANSCD